MNVWRTEPTVGRAVPRPGRAGKTICGCLTGVLASGLLAAGCGEAEISDPVPRFVETPVEYPLELWDANVEGVAVVRVLVNVGGGVDSAMIAEGSGNAVLDSAALQGAWEMEFEPALRKGEPVRVWARVPVHFSKPEAGAGNGGDGTKPNPGTDPNPGADASSAASANPGADASFGAAQGHGRRHGPGGPRMSAAP